MTALWPDPTLAAAILAVDPAGLALRLRMRAGPAREAWLALLRTLLPADQPLRRCPAGIADDRLLGGLDLALTLATGTRSAVPGLLADTDRGIVVLPMAERIAAGLAARLAAVLDSGMVASSGLPARIGLVALDEGAEDDAPPPSALLDRIAITLSPGESAPPTLPPDLDIADAIARLPSIAPDDALCTALCRTALLAGIESLRAPLFALRVATIIAALSGHDRVTDQDAATAARLVLAPRATRLPELPSETTDDTPDPDRPDPGPGDDPGDTRPDQAPTEPSASDPSDTEERAGDLADTVIQAVRAALPPDLLARLRTQGSQRLPTGGNAGGRLETRRPTRSTPPTRGRPIGVRPGDPARGRLDVLATLTAALPWQTLRGRSPDSPRIRVRRDDFHITRFAPRTRLTIIFAVDASGSSARARLDQAKGCVALLLADCYARRDQVALVAFRGKDAAVVLPPTGSVVRARRALDGLPGGGGTPLAAGLDAVLALAEQRRRAGEPSLLVLLTDGRANVARDGSPGRDRADRDALDSAALVRAAGLPTLLVDISPRPGDRIAALAERLGARTLLLPQADPRALATALAGTLAGVA